MSDRLRIVGPDDPALVELGSFQEDPSFQEGWRAHIPSSHGFLSDHYWRFMQDPEAKAANSVGLVIFGLLQRYPEFQNIGAAIADGVLRRFGVERKIGYLSLTVANQTPVLDPDRKVATLVDATNETLQTIGSPYYLPL